jgi:AraC family transcriptional regulator
MVGELITPDQVRTWIPGDLTLDSSAHAWAGLTLKGYRYPDLDVHIPAMRDYMIVAYRGGAARMSRRNGGPWQSDRVGPGVVSILTRAEPSQWRWDQPIDVSHAYLSHDAIASVAAEVFDQDIAQIEMNDQVRSEDPAVLTIMAALEREIQADSLGSDLYVEALRSQLCIHLLRHYASVTLRQQAVAGGLSPRQRRLLVEYVEDNLERPISLAEMAALTRMSVSHLIRKFHADFSCPPHAYVMRQRIEHAKRLLISGQEIPLKLVAARSGFADQSHMSRLFRRALNMTPSEFRRTTSKSS